MALPAAFPHTSVKARSGSNIGFDAACAVGAIIAGVLAWVIPARLSGVAEAWDGHLWWVWLLATALAALLLGVAGPGRWWVWPFILTGSQFVAMIAQTSPGPLAPLGFIFMMGIGAGLLIPALIGSLFRRR